MPSFVVHLLIPPLLVLALRLAPVRPALWMLPFTIFPDLDYFIPPHRAVLTNVFVPLLAGGVWWWMRRERPAHAVYAAVASYYLASHVLMDVFAGGAVLFWPVWNQNFFFHLEIVIDTLTNTPITELETGTEPGAPEVARFFPWLSAFETAMVALTVATLLTVYVLRRVERQREVYLEEMPREPAPTTAGGRELTRGRRRVAAAKGRRRTGNR